jgi:hypothetical protein
VDRKRQREIRQRLLTLEREGADIGRAARRVGWTPEEGLRHLEEFLEDMRLLRSDFARSRTAAQPE